MGGKPHPVREQVDGVQVGGHPLPTFEIADRPHADAAFLGERFLAHSSFESVAANQVTDRVRGIRGHRLIPDAWFRGGARYGMLQVHRLLLRANCDRIGCRETFHGSQTPPVTASRFNLGRVE